MDDILNDLFANSDRNTDDLFASFGLGRTAPRDEDGLSPAARLTNRIAVNKYIIRHLRQP